MKSYVENLKDITLIEPMVSILSSLNDRTRKQLEELADKLTK